MTESSDRTDPAPAGAAAAGSAAGDCPAADFPAAEFPAATAERWRQLALAVLRKVGTAGDDTTADRVDELLSVSTYDGIRVGGLYTAATAVPPSGEPGSPPYTRGTRPAGGWGVRARHDDPDPRATNQAILADLDNGVTSLWLVLGGDGLDPGSLADVLDGVYPDLADVVLDAGADTAAAAEAYLALLGDRGRAGSAAVGGNLGADPLGWLARTGQPADPATAAALAVRCARGAGSPRALTVDATVYHDAGGSDVEELGCAVATGVAYLRALTGAGLDVATAFGQLDFRYAATADQFLTVAKLRAARRLWARVAEVCGAPAAGAQRQHAVTSSAMMTGRDPWANMLRATLACFAAGIGGADAVTVQPFDSRLGRPDAFARRIARNTQSLLIEEANVARVVDPAGGSWYVERLTEDLARQAWDWFTAIERAGGMAAALDRGLVAERLAATWARRSDNIAHRRDRIIGVNEFPNLGEVLPVRVAAAGGDSAISSPQADRVTPAARTGLPRHYYAEAFEALRDRADARDTRPTVFLATLGPAAAHAARAAFAANLFAAGGIATVRPFPAAGVDPAGIAAAFVASGAVAACLCGADADYADAAGALASALRAAGACRVWLAGRPDTGTVDDGVDDYLYEGCDAVAVLDATLRAVA
ncbi:MAG: methylmalonyl-CoA mutase [Micromonosporaceae bacterium]|nr:methylmalonyl-CoA mutase [Micromonosporaceae bacterium]